MLTLLTLNAGLITITFRKRLLFSFNKDATLRYKRIVDYLRGSSDEIVLIQEISSFYSNQLIEDLKPVFPYHVRDYSPRRLISSHMIILSRYPIVSTQFAVFTAQGFFENLFLRKGLLCASFELPGLEFRIVNTHLAATHVLPNPRSVGVEKIRLSQVKQMVEYARNENKVTIIGGDFNTDPDISPTTYKIMTEELVDLFVESEKSASKNIDQHTWFPNTAASQSLFEPAGIDWRIDTFLMVSSVYNKCVNRTRVRIISMKDYQLSDHCPVELSIGIQKTNDSIST